MTYTADQLLTLGPDAEPTAEHMAVLRDALRSARNDLVQSETSAMQYLAAVVFAAVGLKELHLSHDYLRDTAGLILERADLPDGGIVLRVERQEEESELRALLLKHKAVITQSTTPILPGPGDLPALPNS